MVSKAESYHAIQELLEISELRSPPFMSPTAQKLLSPTGDWPTLSVVEPQAKFISNGAKRQLPANFESSLRGSDRPKEVSHRTLPMPAMRAKQCAPPRR